MLERFYWGIYAVREKIKLVRRKTSRETEGHIWIEVRKEIMRRKKMTERP